MCTPVIPKEMKALVFVEKDKLAIIMKPVVMPKRGEALIKVTATTICGTDIHIVKGEYGVAPNRTLGHEPVGIVVALGDGVTLPKIGDRVCVPAMTPCGICQSCQLGHQMQCGNKAFGSWQIGNSIDGCQAEYVICPNADYNLCKIPDGVTDEEAVFCCDIMSTGFRAVEAANVKIGDSVCVCAQGPIGLCATAAARLSGATTILTVETNPERAAISRKFGADEVIDFKKTEPRAEIRRLTGGRGVDVAVECLGTQSTYETCLRSMIAGGTTSSVGVYPVGPLQVPLDTIGAGLGDNRLVFSLCPGGSERMRRLMECIRSGRFDAKCLITHRMKLDDIIKGYDIFANQLEGVLKIIITP